MRIRMERVNNVEKVGYGFNESIDVNTNESKKQQDEEVRHFNDAEVRRTIAEMFKRRYERERMEKEELECEHNTIQIDPDDCDLVVHWKNQEMKRRMAR